MTTIATFDIDNTLVKSSAGHMESLISAIKETYGLEADLKIIKHHGMTDQEIIINILKKYDFNDQIIMSKLKECLNHMESHYPHIVQTENIVILEGVSKLLTQFDQRGIFLGLVTGNLDSIARAKLKKIGISKFFKFGGFGSDHISRTELVKIAVRRAGNLFHVDSKTRIFHFGDAVQDMRAAREAGAVPIGVTTGVFTKQELEDAGAHEVVPNFKDVDRIIQILDGV
jgi:phosphoglycolate phosphatase-like HAD superfamily hydrolase